MNGIKEEALSAVFSGRPKLNKYFAIVQKEPDY